MDGTVTRRLRLVVAYDGGPFSGFARQPGRRTVQGELERTLSELAGAPVETVCAGRTDAGVHARGQVVHADLPDRLDPLARGFVLAWPRPLDLERMRSAAAPLVGEHDFAAFCRQRPGSSTRRRLRSIGVRRVRGLVEVRLVADAFCWQMARSIVGYLLGVGDGRRDPDGTAGVLAGRDRSKVGDVAPPHGLVLESVGYPSVAREATEVDRKLR